MIYTKSMVGAGIAPPVYTRVAFVSSFIVHRSAEPAVGASNMVGVRVLDGRGRNKLAEFQPAIGVPYRFKERVALDFAAIAATTWLVTYTDDERVTIGERGTPP